jgi:type I restriction enzyme S subunit
MDGGNVMSFARYPTYKDSGVEWLGEVPGHWDVKKFRHLFRESAEKIEDEVVGPMLSVSGYRGIEVKEYDDENRRRSAEESVGYRIVRVGQLVVNTMWLNYAGLGVSAHEGHVSPAYRSYWIATDLNRGFVHHLLRSGLYVLGYTRLLTGVRPNSLQMSRDDLMEFPVLVPTREEQTHIAAFLDRETAKIDALVAEQQRLIELLKEKRQAVISHAVTKGLNPEAPMKDSGIEWLGEVPAHWEVRRVKTVSSFTTSGPRGWSERISEAGSLFVQSGDLNATLGIEFSQCKRVDVGDDAEATRTKLGSGDVVVCITGAKTGNVAVATNVSEDAYVNQHLCLIRPTADISARFLGALLKSDVGQTYFEFSQYGLKQGLSLEDVREAPVPLPPHSEQVSIEGHLLALTAKFDTLTAEAQRAIDLLQERRTALISAAVTGQIDVRPAAERVSA